MVAVGKTSQYGADNYSTNVISSHRLSLRPSLYDGDNVVADYVSGSATKYYVTPFLDQNLSVTDVSGSATSYYTADGLGSVRTISDSSGTLKNKHDFEAFGSPYSAGTSETIANRYTYTGREKSGVGGPMNYRNRTYFPTLGRFGSRDPAGYPNNLRGNLYDYVYSNPPNGVDPYGLSNKPSAAQYKKRADYHSKRAELVRKLAGLAAKRGDVASAKKYKQELFDLLKEARDLRKAAKGGGRGDGANVDDYFDIRVTAEECCIDPVAAELRCQKELKQLGMKLAGAPTTAGYVKTAAGLTLDAAGGAMLYYGLTTGPVGWTVGGGVLLASGLYLTVDGWLEVRHAADVGSAAAAAMKKYCDCDNIFGD